LFEEVGHHLQLQKPPRVVGRVVGELQENAQSAFLDFQFVIREELDHILGGLIG